MSYRLFYDKVAVKLNNGKYLFFELGGDSNFWENDFKKRVRDWYAINIGGEFCLTKEQILSIPEMILEERIERNKDETVEDIKNNFGWVTAVAVGGRSTAGTKYKNFYGFYSGGIKNAIPAKDFFNDNFRANISMSSYEQDENIYEPIKDEETLIRVIEKHNEKFGLHITFGTTYKYVQDAIKRYRRDKKIEEKKELLKDKTVFYTIQSNRYFNNQYIKGVYKKKYSIKPGCFISTDIHDSIIFDTKKKAEKFIDKKNIHDVACIVKIKKEKGKYINSYSGYEIIDDPKF